jgi:hypothetical protein
MTPIASTGGFVALYHIILNALPLLSGFPANLSLHTNLQTSSLIFSLPKKEGDSPFVDDSPSSSSDTSPKVHNKHSHSRICYTYHLMIQERCDYRPLHRYIRAAGARRCGSGILYWQAQLWVPLLSPLRSALEFCQTVIAQQLFVWYVLLTPLSIPHWHLSMRSAKSKKYMSALQSRLTEM